jgi:hypothetical protein
MAPTYDAIIAMRRGGTIDETGPRRRHFQFSLRAAPFRYASGLSLQNPNIVL